MGMVLHTQLVEFKCNGVNLRSCPVGTTVSRLIALLPHITASSISTSTASTGRVSAAAVIGILHRLIAVIIPATGATAAPDSSQLGVDIDLLAL